MMLIKYLLPFFFWLIASPVFSQISPVDLTCEYLTDPAVVDELRPRLSWINRAVSGKRGQVQSAYQIRVASAVSRLSQPDLWDSGRISGNASLLISYEGKPLPSASDIFWQVRVWDGNGKASSWSRPGKWHMGLLKEEEWKATWIGAPWQGEEAIPKPPGGPDERTKISPPNAPLLRKAFAISKKVEKAMVYTTGLGYFEFYTNGQKVSDDLLVPNQTNYDKRPQLPQAGIPLPDAFRDYHVMYMAYDITPLLKSGENIIGAILGNGFYNPPKFWTASYGSPRFLAQLRLTYTDGTVENICSDTSWKAARSAIVSDLVFDGEVYDARLEQPGWSAPGFDDTAWENAGEKRKPFGKLVAHTAPTDKVTATYSPVKMEKLPNGNYKVDFEEEISGWIRFRNISGPSGHTIKLTFNSNQYSGENTYTFNGEKNAHYAPRFNWFVFSSVEIHNWPGELKAEQLVAEAVNTDVMENAVFQTSNQLFNRINHIWKRSQMDNMHGGIASDCPHRERSGYTGDAQVVCQTVMHNFDARAFYTKWMRDILGAQIPETGYIPNGAPWQPGCGGGVAWGAAICILPWEFYRLYDDKAMLLRHFEAMKAYVQYMKTWTDDKGIMYSQRPGKDGKPLMWLNLGEWAGTGTLPPDRLVHTFYYWMCADITASVAALLGKEADAKEFRSLGGNIRYAFTEAFYDAEAGSFGKYGANIFALMMGLDREMKVKVLETLRKDIQQNNGHLDTGIFGTRYFFEILAENGMNDLAYEAMNKTKAPGYGHWVEQGSTTTREQWDDSGSHNHPMFGGGLGWFYKHLAGMQAEAPGYRIIRFKPMPVKGVDFARYETNTVYGQAGISWKQDEGFEMQVEVPVGCTARVFFPVGYDKVFENGSPVENRKDIKIMADEEDRHVFEIGSGRYVFKAR